MEGSSENEVMEGTAIRGDWDAMGRGFQDQEGGEHAECFKAGDS